MNKLLSFLYLDKLLAIQKHSKPLKSGFMIIDENGVAQVDYNDPKARENLRKQIDDFTKIAVTSS